MRSKKSGKALRVLWWCALTVFVTSAVFLVVYLLQASSQKQAMEQMSAYVRGESASLQATADAPVLTMPPVLTPQEAQPTEQQAAQPAATLQPPVQSTPSAVPPSMEDEALIRRFETLAQQNEDFVGWLSVAGTRIDDPVMYSPNDSQHYLYRDFDGAYSISGLPFLDASCDLEPVAGNKIIYGHNMKDGTRFADLKLYLDDDFFREQPYIQFDTLYGRGRYQVMAAFTIRVGELDDPSMLCYRQIDTTNEDALQELSHYLDEHARQRVEGVQPLLGDELLTLSTCGRPGMSERVIVMARRVYE